MTYEWVDNWEISTEYQIEALMEAQQKVQEAIESLAEVQAQGNNYIGHVKNRLRLTILDQFGYGGHPESQNSPEPSIMGCILKVGEQRQREMAEIPAKETYRHYYEQFRKAARGHGLQAAIGPQTVSNFKDYQNADQFLDDVIARRPAREGKFASAALHSVKHRHDMSVQDRRARNTAILKLHTLTVTKEKR